MPLDEAVDCCRQGTCRVQHERNPLEHRGFAEASEFFKKEVPGVYAIITTGGKQYKVSEGDVIEVEKLDAEAGKTVTFDQVLAVGGDAMKVADEVKNATVSATVMEQGRGKKVTVYHFKPKTGNHKKNGHRQAYTRVRIDAINA